MRAAVDVDAERDAAAHRHRERLRAAHAAEPGGHDEAAAQAAAESLPRHRLEGLEGALQDALGADVDPRPRGHLPVHGQPHGLEPPELLPRRPARHEQRVGDQHARCQLVRAGDADRLARLHQQGLVVAQASAASRRWRRSTPRSAPRAPCRRRRRASPGPRRPSGSRLFIRQRSGASVCQLPQLSVFPRGARTGRAPAVIAASPRRRRARSRHSPSRSPCLGGLEVAAEDAVGAERRGRACRSV